MLQYLSVHDIVWINSTLTGEKVPFDYENLEAAMAAQYNYGDSTDVRGQSANFLASFILKPPFAYGNLRTAFVSASAFLNANGQAVQVGSEQAVEIMRALARRETTAQAAVDLLASPTANEPNKGIALRALVTHICSANSSALDALKEGDE